jgi:Ca2+-binding EF-hand superfamily protein
MSPAARAAAEAAREADNTRLREAELLAAREKFHELDQDGSGALDLGEVADLARWALQSFQKSKSKSASVMSQGAVDAEVAKLMASADVDGDGELDFDEFAVSSQNTRILPEAS